MSEKEEVLRQISEIKTHLVDKEAFFPYNFNACHVWSAIAVVLTLVMIPAYETSVAFGTTVTTLLVLVGFIIEAVMTKKVNESYDIDDCTRRQQYIMSNFIMIALFAIVFSTLLALYKLYVPIMLLWLFLISLGHLGVGFVLNIKAYGTLAKVNMIGAMILLSLAIYFNLLEAQGSFLLLVQVMVILGLAVFPSLIAFKQQKVEQKGCSV